MIKYASICHFSDSVIDVIVEDITRISAPNSACFQVRIVFQTELSRKYKMSVTTITFVQTAKLAKLKRFHLN
jgi:hypothetical protein